MLDDKGSFNLEVALLSVSDAKFRKPIKPEMDLVIKTVCEKSTWANAYESLSNISSRSINV